MPKTIFTAVTPIGATFTRTSSSMRYTHAVVSSLDVISWHTSQALAARARNAHRHSSILKVVPVTGVEFAMKKTSEAERNATRRGVITRKINSWTAHLARREAELLTWEAGGREQTLARLVQTFGETYGATAHARRDEEVRSDVTFCRRTIAKLEAERDALLAAEAPSTLVEA